MLGLKSLVGEWANNIMQERTRYRVTGSLFLFALAVIFLPMIFDGAGTTDSDAATPRSPQKAPPIPSEAFVPNPAPRFQDIVPVTDVVEKVSELRSEVDDEGFLTDSQTRIGEPVLSKADANTAVWAVQAATFGSSDNARSFRQRLRDAGLEAFISSVKSDAESEASDSVMYRVAVGPLLSPLDAQDIQARIQQEFSVKPQIVAMEP